MSALGGAGEESVLGALACSNTTTTDVVRSTAGPAHAPFCPSVLADTILRSSIHCCSQLRTVLQLPMLVHGPNKIADSTLIFEYLCNTFPEQMKVFDMQDPVKYASSSSSVAIFTARVVFAAVHTCCCCPYTPQQCLRA